MSNTKLSQKLLGEKKPKQSKEIGLGEVLLGIEEMIVR